MPICIVFSSHTVEKFVLFVDFFSVGLCVCWVVSATPLTVCAYIFVESETGVDDLGFSKWIEQIQGKPDKDAAGNKKVASKWRPTTKGTLKRNCRVSSISEGRRLLKSIASLLSDDDQFRDATSHKGCQIRRESAHGESVCCNNVRALFDELPTPHVLVEITPFPAGPLTENDYAKAEKLERLLRPGPSI